MYLPLGIIIGKSVAPLPKWVAGEVGGSRVGVTSRELWG